MKIYASNNIKSSKPPCFLNQTKPNWTNQLIDRPFLPENHRWRTLAGNRKLFNRHSRLNRRSSLIRNWTLTSEIGWRRKEALKSEEGGGLRRCWSGALRRRLELVRCSASASAMEERRWAGRVAGRRRFQWREVEHGCCEGSRKRSCVRCSWTKKREGGEELRRFDSQGIRSLFWMLWIRWITSDFSTRQPAINGRL